MATSCTDFSHPFYEELKCLSLEERHKFFTGERMKFVSLGEMLDFISIGALNFVSYRLNTKDMVKLTANWMTSNQPPYQWNDPRKDPEQKLPRIEHKSCPENEHHVKTIKDLAGRVRCADPECYSIISEKEFYLPLEQVLQRLDCSFKFYNAAHFTAHPFSGFTLAGFVKAWFQQPGDRRLLMPTGREDRYRAFPNFEPMSSEE